MSNTSSALLTIGLVGMTGCIDPGPEFSSEDSEIFVETGTTLWHGSGGRGNRDVPVCWEPAQGPTPPGGFAAEQAIVMEQMRRSWQAVSGIRVVDRGACATTGTEQMIRVRTRGANNPNAHAGSIGGSTKTVGVANLMPPAVGDDTMSMAVDVDLRWDTTTGRWVRPGSDNRLRYISGHEFGHILGFSHEQHSAGGGEHAQICRGTAAASAGTEVTTYDRDSIMNYCQTGGNWTGALTALDVQGARKLYGWRDATDYDNDGRSNLAVFRPNSGQWFVEGGVWGTPYGEAGDVPLAGDFDGDGSSDLAVWRPSGPYQGYWFITLSTGGERRVQWGAPGDIPTTGDLDGNGRNELIVYRPSNRTFYILEPDGAGRAVGPWGEAGDIPVLADYDGDGKTDLALFRPGGAYAGYWFVLDSTTPGSYSSRKYGEANDIPVVGDFDGDRRSDFAVWRPSNGWWYVLPAGGGAEIRTKFGEPGDIPVSLDYTGDAITELSVWRPSNGTWYIATPSAWVAALQMGAPGDIPLGRTIR